MNTELFDEKEVKKGQETDPEVAFSIKQFRSIAKQQFDLDINLSIEPTQIIKDTAKLLSFSLPANLSEVFIKAEESHILWILDTPLNNYLKEYLKLHVSKTAGTELLKAAKESYQKWVFNKSLSEKKYFAASFINIAEKKYANNFWLQLLLASLYFSEKSCQNYIKSAELIEKVKDYVLQNKLNDNYKEELLYYFKLLSGFTDVKQNNFFSANEKFSEAIKINPFSITSKFYLALSELKLNNVEVAEHLVKEIINFDNFRCMHAINNLNAGMLHFFIQNPVMRNVFFYNEFAPLSDAILGEVYFDVSVLPERCRLLSKKTQKLDELKLREFFNEETTQIVNFIQQVITYSGKSKSFLFCNVLPEIEAKFDLAVNNIKTLIRARYYDEIQENLATYNYRIEEKLEEVENIKTEHAEYLQKLQLRLNEAVEKVELEAAENISYVEEKINNIVNVPSLSPRHSFTKAMTYNFIVSVLVFMLGGCTGYTNSFVYNVWEFKEVAGMIVVSGLKWGGITFLTGILVSFIAAAYVIMERSNEKQKLVKRISFIKEEKEREKDLLQKDFTSSEKSINTAFNKRINERNLEAKMIADDKDKEEKRLKEIADAKIEAEIRKLEEVSTQPDAEEPFVSYPEIIH